MIFLIWQLFLFSAILSLSGFSDMALANDAQKTLQDGEHTDNNNNDTDTAKPTRFKVPGDSPAWYCSDPETQLFKIESFDVTPNPPGVYAFPFSPATLSISMTDRQTKCPASDKQLIARLRGSFPDIAETLEPQLNLSVTLNGTKTNSLERPLCRFPHIAIEQGGKFGCPLQKGPAALTGDFIIFSFDLETGNYTVRAESYLRDGRTLFCFEGSFFLKGED